MNWYIKIAQSSGVKLWLDDERNPKNPIIQQRFGSIGDEIWVKNTYEAQSYIEQGNVIFIDFDNDLGAGTPEGIDLAKWILQQALSGTRKPPEYKVHSMNPVASKRIDLTMKDAHRVWDEQQKNPPK